MDCIGKQRILILGIGNTLLSDEGFGPAAVRQLEHDYEWAPNIRLVDGATLGLMLMPELLESDLVIILDIALGGKEPGTMYELSAEELGAGMGARCSMHQTGINDVLISCELAGHKPCVRIFAMEPFDYQTFSPEITSEAAALLPEFCRKTVSALQKMGMQCHKR